MSVGIFELVNGVLTKKKIAGKTLMDAQLNANSRNGVQNRIITGEINDIKDDISTINTHLSELSLDNVDSMSLSNTSNTMEYTGGSALFVELINSNGVCIDSSPLLSDVTLQFYNSGNNTWRQVQLARSVSGKTTTVSIVSATNVSDCTCRLHAIR